MGFSGGVGVLVLVEMLMVAYKLMLMVKLKVIMTRECNYELNMKLILIMSTVLIKSLNIKLM